MTVAQKATEAQGYDLPYHWLRERRTIWRDVHDVYVREAVERVRATGASRVIEIGCGDGWNCAQLLEVGVEHVVGADWSEKGIAHATNLVPDAEFFCGDTTDSSFAASFPDPFDAVLLVEVIEHIPPEHTVLALQNMRSLVRGGGHLVLTTPSTNWPNTNSLHYRHFTPGLLRELFAEAGGWECVSIEGYGDLRAIDRAQRCLRLVDNRLFVVKPLQRRILDWCKGRGVGVDVEHCLGLVASFRAV